MVECDVGDIFDRLNRMLSSNEWSKWLNETMQAFATALSGIAERRASDIIAALFLAQVGSSVYAASRIVGRDSGEALAEAEKTLHKIYCAALEILRESFKSGKLEEQYRRALRELGGEAGSGDT